MPYTQVPLGPLDLVLRAEPGRSVREGLLAILADFDDRVELRSYRSVESVMAEQFVEPTFFATLLASFAAMALLLSSVGLYSTLAHAVQSRRRELGIRMALGADADRLVRRVVVRGSTVAALGVALGLGLAAAGSGLLEAFLFGTTPTEPSVWAWASGLMLAVGGLASWVPARMAGRVDPAISLRAE